MLSIPRTQKNCIKSFPLVEDGVTKCVIRASRVKVRTARISIICLCLLLWEGAAHIKCENSMATEEYFLLKYVSSQSLH